MILADEIRAAFVLGASKNFYLIEEPWYMMEEPWRCFWVDKRSGKTCEINVVGNPQEGEKYVMFAVYTENKEVHNYVFLLDQYHYIGGNDAASVN